MPIDAAGDEDGEDSDCGGEDGELLCGELPMLHGIGFSSPLPLLASAADALLKNAAVVVRVASLASTCRFLVCGLAAGGGGLLASDTSLASSSAVGGSNVFGRSNGGLDDSITSGLAA